MASTQAAEATKKTKKTVPHKNESTPTVEYHHFRQLQFSKTFYSFLQAEWPEKLTFDEAELANSLHRYPIRAKSKSSAVQDADGGWSATEIRAAYAKYLQSCPAADDATAPAPAPARESDLPADLHLKAYGHADANGNRAIVLNSYETYGDSVSTYRAHLAVYDRRAAFPAVLRSDELRAQSARANDYTCMFARVLPGSPGLMDELGLPPTAALGLRPPVRALMKAGFYHAGPPFDTRVLKPCLYRELRRRALWYGARMYVDKVRNNGPDALLGGIEPTTPDNSPRSAMQVRRDVLRKLGAAVCEVLERAERPLSGGQIFRRALLRDESWTSLAAFCREYLGCEPPASVSVPAQQALLPSRDKQQPWRLEWEASVVQALFMGRLPEEESLLPLPLPMHHRSWKPIRPEMGLEEPVWREMVASGKMPSLRSCVARIRAWHEQEEEQATAMEIDDDAEDRSRTHRRDRGLSPMSQPEEKEALHVTDEEAVRKERARRQAARQPSDTGLPGAAANSIHAATAIAWEPAPSDEVEGRHNGVMQYYSDVWDDPLRKTPVGLPGAVPPYLAYYDYQYVDPQRDIVVLPACAMQYKCWWGFANQFLQSDRAKVRRLALLVPLNRQGPLNVWDPLTHQFPNLEELIYVLNGADVLGTPPNKECAHSQAWDKATHKVTWTLDPQQKGSLPVAFPHRAEQYKPGAFNRKGINARDWAVLRASRWTGGGPLPVAMNNEAFAEWKQQPTEQMSPFAHNEEVVREPVYRGGRDRPLATITYAFMAVKIEKPVPDVPLWFQYMEWCFGNQDVIGPGDVLVG